MSDYYLETYEVDLNLLNNEQLKVLAERQRKLLEDMVLLELGVSPL